ncbi:glucose-1-phosphate thymidylyltransferase [Myxococcaceae bacterium]|nr:glucose-1-phosphate thymidylyltransferase [Myxococcaceae bacterium]
MKALVLAAGRGRRLDPESASINKCMLPLGGKPLARYSLENAVRAGVSEIVMVVSYRAEDIINHFGIEFQGVRVRYVIQDDPQGLVHAIECSADAIGNSDFMLFLADEILIHPKHAGMLELFEREGLFVTCGVVVAKRKEEIRKTYAVIQDSTDGRIHRLIEKPRNPFDLVQGTGNCVFKFGIFDYLPLTPINPNRGEKELPDLIQCAVDDGKPVKAFDIGSIYINVNTADDIRLAELEGLVRGETA